MTDNKNINDLLSQILDRIIREYQPKKIILFGSYAYGEPNEDSDIDLLIVKNTDKRLIDRWIEVKRLLRGISQNIPITPLIYTEKELEERKAIKALLF